MALVAMYDHSMSWHCWTIFALDFMWLLPPRLWGSTYLLLINRRLHIWTIHLLPVRLASTWNYIHYWRPRLCRVFLHSAKSPLHSAKALPSVALGKVRSAKFFSAKGLCRVLFIGALGKIKKQFCRVLGAALGKIFSAVAAPAVNGYFAECPTQHSAKKNIF